MVLIDRQAINISPLQRCDMLLVPDSAMYKTAIDVAHM
jgi:hypothetical protein